MKLKILTLILSLSAISLSFAQSPDTTKPKKIYVLKRVLLIRSAPVFTLQLNLNYDQAMGQLAGTYNDDFRSDQFVSGRSLGSNKGFGVNLVGKLSSPNDHIRFTLSATYNRMLTYFFSKAELADVGESKFNVYSFGLGLENNFTPGHKVKLYVGAEGLFSIINGKAHLWIENKPEKPYEYDVKIKNSYRIGAAIFGGAEYLISNNFGFNIGFKFTHANLLLKEAKASDDPNEINLVDDESDSNNPVPYSGRKQIVFLSVVTGINLYWGIHEKRYILAR